MKDRKQTILVPIDFSNESIQGLRTAFVIAKNKSRKILLLHSTYKQEIERNESDDPGYKDATEEDKLVLQKLEHLRGLRIQYHIPGIQVQMKVLVNPTHSIIEEVIQRYNVDLVVVGSQNEDPISEYFLKQDQSERHILGVPLLNVQHYNNQNGFNNLLIDVDLTHIAEKHIQIIKKFVESLDMKLLITHTLENDEMNVESLEDNLNNFVKKSHFSDHTLINTEVIKTGIELDKLAGQKDVDMLLRSKSINKNKIRLHQNEKRGSKIDWKEDAMLSLV